MQYFYVLTYLSTLFGITCLLLHRRVPPEDVIVLKANCKYRTWEDLVQEPGNVIGTSSVRRQAQLRARWPNLKFNDIRGNLNTRLRKLDDENGPYQALILAAAGILRLDWEQRIHRVSSLRTYQHIRAATAGKTPKVWSGP